MIGGVTRHMLPHLSGVPHLHVNRPQGYIYTLLDPFLCRHENLSWYSVNSNCTRLEQVVHTHQTSVWCTKYQSSLRLSRVPVVASTHLLLLRFEYLFTLRRRVTETYPLYDEPFSRLARCSIVPLPFHCCYV